MDECEHDMNPEWCSICQTRERERKLRHSQAATERIRAEIERRREDQ